MFVPVFAPPLLPPLLPSKNRRADSQADSCSVSFRTSVLESEGHSYGVTLCLMCVTGRAELPLDSQWLSRMSVADCSEWGDEPEQDGLQLQTELLSEREPTLITEKLLVRY